MSPYKIATSRAYSFNALKKITFLSLAALILTLWTQPIEAKRYGDRYCKEAGYTCVKVKKGQTWSSIFPNAYQREVVQRLNRMNTGLYAGMRIAVPNNLAQTDLLAISPFPAQISAPGRKTIMVELQKLAFGAYDPNGNLIHWGPISAGQNYCSDIKRGCRTIKGSFQIYTKKGAGCKSSKYPVGKGGAPMPYCMFFHKGYALHASTSVPGYNASHGCIRLFREDAKWLNTEFMNSGGNGGTRVIIRSY